MEALAAEYVMGQGCRILQRNFRCRLGEIDLIGQMHAHILFIEVRARAHTTYGRAEETIIWRKQQKIIRTARFFLMKNPWAMKLCCRFDVIAIASQETPPKIQWITNAFQL
jgi:putative endonuclease